MDLTPPPGHPVARTARSLADRLIAEIDGAGAVVVASADGFCLAHAGPRRIDPARVAAMASSTAALGEAASAETAIGQPRCMVIDSSAGRLVLRCMRFRGDSLIVTVLTDARALLGSVWTRMVEAERELDR